MEHIIFRRWGQNSIQMPEDCIQVAYPATSTTKIPDGYEKLKKHEYDILYKSLLPKFQEWENSLPDDDDEEL